jgi:outer membrane protein assembly factor BamB
MTVAVLTRSYDNTRSGANTSEPALSPDVVAKGLRRLFSLTVDDDPRLEAQPLIVPGVRMADGSTHDVVYVCTMANNVWAFDANNGTKLWPKPVNLGKPINGAGSIDPKGGNTIDLWRINILWGILSTPVVDVDAQTMYLVSWSIRDGSPTDTVDPKRGPNNTVHRLHAIPLADGNDRHPPIEVAPTATAKDGSTIKFVSVKQKQRAALLLAPLRSGGGAPVKKTLFMGCGQTQETLDGHGWVVAFDVDNFRQTAAWCATPNGKGAGVWQAGQGPVADSRGFVYLQTGNGTWSAGTDFGESVVKLSYTPPASAGAAGKLAPADYFTPFRDKDRGKELSLTTNLRGGVDFGDQDLGSAAPLVLEGLGLVVGCGKDGVLYVMDRNNLGKAFRDFNTPGSKPDLTKLKSPPIFFTFFPGFGVNAADEATLDQFVLNEQIHPARDKTHHLHGSPVFWDSPDHGPMLFCWGENENLRAWGVAASGTVTFLAMGNEQASAGSVNPGGMPGGLLTLSANGPAPHSGVVWATVPLKGLTDGKDNNGDANQHVVEGILYAYDATDFGTCAGGSRSLKLLWDSKRTGVTFHFDKFCPPVVANGKVYVATYDGRVDVYGP